MPKKLFCYERIRTKCFQGFDICCGYGAITLILVEEMGADCSIRIDVEEPVYSAASVIPYPIVF